MFAQIKAVSLGGKHLCVFVTFFCAQHRIPMINIDNLFKVINPIKDKYEIKYLPLEFLVKCCCNYGSWRILIGEEK